jgi:D-glycero-alpha-D-manno-heptose 1-phosphate guanylyltransferase
LITAVILAGGLGTRLRSVVPDLPKPMAPVSGRPFLEHQLDYWMKYGVSHFVLSVCYRYQAIIDHFGNNYKGADLEYVIEKTPLGTGGGLLLAAEKISKFEPFLLLNGDTYFAIDLKALIDFAHLHDTDWCFSLFHTDQEDRYLGIDISEQGIITSFKLSANRPKRLANGGVYLVNPRALNYKKYLPGDKVSLEDDIFPTSLAIGQRFMGLEFQGAFIDIGVPEDYYRASDILAK